MSEGHLDNFILTTDSHKGMFNSMGINGCATKIDIYIYICKNPFKGETAEYVFLMEMF